MATAARNFQDRQISEQLAQSASLTQTTPVTATPFSDNEQWLENSVNELRARDQEYRRLQTEQARGEWEQITRANLLRQQAQAADRQDRIDRYNSDTENHDAREAAILLRHANSIAATIPQGSHAWNMPLDKLKELSNTMQPLSELAQRYGQDGFDGTALDPLAATQQLAAQQPERTQKATRPSTFPDGSTVQITQNDDGTLEARLITGEIFRGDPLTITRTLGEAQVNTKIWARQKVAQAQQPAQQPNGNGAAPNSAVTFDANGTPQVDFEKIPDVTRWQLDQMAASLGYKDGAEMVQDQIAQRQRTAELEQRLTEREEKDFMLETAMSFIASAPDFPNTDDSIAALERVIQANGWEWTPQNMAAAHAVAVRQGLYTPLSQQEQQAASGNQAAQHRPVAPPMPHSGSPEQTFRSPDPWNMPIADLRKQAIRQELEGRH